MMLIKALVKIRVDGEIVPPGAERNFQEAEAFRLIEQAAAEPANRWSRKRFEEMKAEKIAATPPEGPDIRDRYVSAPKVQVQRPLTLKR